MLNKQGYFLLELLVGMMLLFLWSSAVIKVVTRVTHYQRELLAYRNQLFQQHSYVSQVLAGERVPSGNLISGPLGSSLHTVSVYKGHTWHVFVP